MPHCIGYTEIELSDEHKAVMDRIEGRLDSGWPRLHGALGTGDQEWMLRGCMCSAHFHIRRRYLARRLEEEFGWNADTLFQQIEESREATKLVYRVGEERFMRVGARRASSHWSGVNGCYGYDPVHDLLVTQPEWKYMVSAGARGRRLRTAIDEARAEQLVKEIVEGIYKLFNSNGHWLPPVE
jgi:hypothetical protein